MTNKQRLLSYLMDRPTHFTKDSETFLWARTSHFREFNERNLGGGNLLIALGLFAALSYLGKIYHLLRGKPVFSDQEKAREAHRQLPSEMRALLFPKPDGWINETDAFGELVLDAPHIMSLGLRKDDVTAAYVAIRHKLTHMIAPSQGNVVLANIAEDLSFEEVQRAIADSPATSFEYLDQVRQLDVDMLVRDVTRIRDWLAQAVNEGSFDDQIDVTLEWVEKSSG